MNCPFNRFQKSWGYTSARRKPSKHSGSRAQRKASSKLGHTCLPRRFYLLHLGRRGLASQGVQLFALEKKKNAYTVNTPRYCAWCTKIPVPEKIHKSDPGGGSPASPKLANLSVFSVEADGLALWTLEPYLSKFNASQDNWEPASSSQFFQVPWEQ